MAALHQLTQRLYLLCRSFDQRGGVGGGGVERCLLPFLNSVPKEGDGLASCGVGTGSARSRSTERAASYPLPACLPTPASTPCSAWWSSSKRRPAWSASGYLRQLLNFSSIVCRMLARMHCLLEFQPEVTHFESPGPVSYSEDRLSECSQVQEESQQPSLFFRPALSLCPYLCMAKTLSSDIY